MIATSYTRTATAMKTQKINGGLLRNRQIHNIVGQISPSYVFGRHALWPSWSLFVAIMSLFVAIMVTVCGHHGHCLWPSWSLFVAIMVTVCGHHGLWPSWSNPLQITSYTYGDFLVETLKELFKTSRTAEITIKINVVQFFV